MASDDPTFAAAVLQIAKGLKDHPAYALAFGADIVIGAPLAIGGNAIASISLALGGFVVAGAFELGQIIAVAGIASRKAAARDRQRQEVLVLGRTKALEKRKESGSDAN